MPHFYHSEITITDTLVLSLVSVCGLYTVSSRWWRFCSYFAFFCYLNLSVLLNVCLTYYPVYIQISPIPPHISFTLGLLSQDSVWARPQLVAGFSVMSSPSISSPSLSQVPHPGPRGFLVADAWCPGLRAGAAPPAHPGARQSLLLMWGVQAWDFSLLETTCGKCHCLFLIKL